MFRKLKNSLYFFVAAYFKFFATVQLAIWRPKIVVVTGSNGKTTTLHLLEAQLQDTARYSHHANSTFGIPFDILGLRRETYAKSEWLKLFLLAPFRSFKRSYKERVYVVEADCERPGEGKFLASLLKPAMVIWLSVARTHSYNFDKRVSLEGFASVDEAIAHEFGYFLECVSELAMINGDNPLIKQQMGRAKTTIKVITKKDHLSKYSVSLQGTSFILGATTYSLPFFLPEETFYSVVAVAEVAPVLNRQIDPTFAALTMPPGRSSLFKGMKGTTLIDSSYNANVASVEVIVSMVGQLSEPKKWIVLGDLTEQGEHEQEEHEKLVAVLKSVAWENIILVGPRLAKYVYPLLQKDMKGGVQSFIETKDAREYMVKTLQGNEVIVFKGARFLEGIIETLLADKADVSKLCRRGVYWERVRKQWSL